jgi:predicted negative regulator of RcsB-dependent stress response
MVQRYGDTMSGQEGRLLLAQIFFQQGKPQDGLKVLDEADASGPLKVSVLAIRAAGLEQSGKPAEAAAAYLEAAAASTTETEQASLRGDAARAYVAAGKPEEALKIWRPMAEDETSPMNAEAKLRVGELSALTTG